MTWTIILWVAGIVFIISYLTLRFLEGYKRDEFTLWLLDENVPHERTEEEKREKIVQLHNLRFRDEFLHVILPIIAISVFIAIIIYLILSGKTGDVTDLSIW